MSLVEQITGVFSAIAEWIAGVIPTLFELFYNPETGLTFLGITAILSLGIGVFLLLMNIVKSFLTFQ